MLLAKSLIGGACDGDSTRCCFLAGLFRDGVVSGPTVSSTAAAGIPNPQRYSSIRFLIAMFVVR